MVALMIMTGGALESLPPGYGLLAVAHVFPLDVLVRFGHVADGHAAELLAVRQRVVVDH